MFYGEVDNYNNPILEKCGNYEFVKDMNGYYINLKSEIEKRFIVAKFQGSITEEMALYHAKLFWNAVVKSQEPDTWVF